MAKIVLGIGTSHTPMLNAPAQVWPRFVERDSKRAHLDRNGQAVTYDELLRQAPADIARQLTSEVFARRHGQATAAVDTLAAAIAQARLDVLIVVGDDQKELFLDDNLPAILLYRGPTIRNVPLRDHPGPDWARAASALYYEATETEFPVHQALAEHLMAQLIEEGFDLASSDRLQPGAGEGHAFAFVRKRLMGATPLPVVPFFLNTYYPPNQPTPARCVQLGAAIARAVAAWPQDQRVGIVGSGGLSHFTIDEDLDARVMDALRRGDMQALASLPRQQLQSGNSEIRNWITMAAAVQHLALDSMVYVPGYRTPAGTGTGMCFAVWR